MVQDQSDAGGLGWLDIFRLGLVQAALGGIVVITTSTLNRIMVVELALPAMIPGALVALHHVVQVLRPRWGYGSDMSGSRTPWIVGGMVVLALGGWLAAASTALMKTEIALGLMLGVVGFIVIGLGAGAAGTSLLVLLAKRVAPRRRAAAATITWVMMIVGFILTTVISGQFLDPYSPGRLLMVTTFVCVIAVAVSTAAVWGIERRAAGYTAAAREENKIPFGDALRQVWKEQDARRFTVFVFLSMLAYSMQDLILEPYAGTVFGFTPGESTKLSGVQHSGVLSGMILVAICATAIGGRIFGSLKLWTVAGCIGSGIVLLGITIAGQGWNLLPLKTWVFLLGLLNGAFAIAAIASMMTLAGQGAANREGVRMGLWGASQAIAFAAGGFVGTVLCDAMRTVVSQPASAYGIVFTLEAGIFLVSAAIALRLNNGSASFPRFDRVVGSQQLGHELAQGD